MENESIKHRKVGRHVEQVVFVSPHFQRPVQCVFPHSIHELVGWIPKLSDA
jgi:hypothetical protein